jgi:hypothetical protein
MVKEFKVLKTSVKFLCWFGVVSLIFGLVSLRHVIPVVYAVGYPAYRARCFGCSVVEHASCSRFKINNTIVHKLGLFYCIDHMHGDE